MKTIYRGRIAPSPTGYLHVGHAVTFWRAQERARGAGGKLILRIEDLDTGRCRPEFSDALLEDLRWFGLIWEEGPDVGGPAAPYLQSARRAGYARALAKLRMSGSIYPCSCSRKDVTEAAVAPHDENEEPIYPGTCRRKGGNDPKEAGHMGSGLADHGGPVHWRFRVPEGEELCYVDGRLGEQRAIAGRDFGDFIVWRRDDVPAYQLAVVVDDSAMGITEVVRGEDLLISTFRQLLIYRALGIEPPGFYHTALLLDESGRRLAKRHASLSLRALRAAGVNPNDIRERYMS